MLKNKPYLAAALILVCSLVSLTGEVASREDFPVFPKPATQPGTLPSLPGPIHLGDEELPDWPVLFGNCLDLDLHIVLPVRSLTLILQTRGLEINAPVYLNYHKIAVLPPQTGPPAAADNSLAWSTDLSIPLPVDKLCPGVNRITITTGLVPNPKFSGDLADFQLRNLRLVLQ